MSAGSTDGGTVVVKLVADLTGFQNALNSANSQVQAFTNKVSATGKEFLKLGALITAPFIEAARVGAGFQDKMSAVQAVTQATSIDFQQLNDKAKQLGATTSFTAAEVAEAMQFMGLAGFKTDQILSGVADTLNLARAGSLGLGRASDIATDLVSAFGLEVRDLKRVTDVLAITQANANTNIDQMGEAFKFVAPIAKATGQSIEETSAILGVLGNRMLKGSIAGTGLSIVLSKLAKSETQKKLKALGVEVVKIDGTFRRLSDIMKDLGKGLEGLGEAEKLATLGELFDARGQKTAINLIAAVGKEFDSLRDKTDKAIGTAETMAQVMDNNLGGAWRRAMSSLEGVKIAITEAITGELRKSLGAVSSYLSALNSWVKDNTKLVISIGKVGIGLAAIGATMVAGAFAVSTFSSALTGIVGAVAVTIGTLKKLTMSIMAMQAVTISLSASTIPKMILALKAMYAQALITNGVLLKMHLVKVAFLAAGGGVKGFAAALSMLKILLLPLLPALATFATIIAALAVAGYMAKLGMDIQAAREETLKLNNAIGDANKQLSDLRQAKPFDTSAAKIATQQYIADLRRRGKTDAEIKSQLVAQERKFIKDIASLATAKNALSGKEQLARKADLRLLVHQFKMAQEAELNEFLLTEEQKRAAAQKTAEMQKRMSADRLKELKDQADVIAQGIAAFQKNLGRTREARDEEEQFSRDIAEDPAASSRLATRNQIEADKKALALKERLENKLAEVRAKPTEENVRELSALKEQYEDAESSIDRWRRRALSAASEVDNQMEDNKRKEEQRQKQVYGQAESIAKKVISAREAVLSRIDTTGSFDFDIRTVGEVAIGKEDSLQNIMEQEEKNTKKTSELTEKIYKLFKQGGMVFTGQGV